MSFRRRLKGNRPPKGTFSVSKHGLTACIYNNTTKNHHRSPLLSSPRSLFPFNTGWELIEDVIEDFEQQLKEAVNEDHNGKEEKRRKLENPPTSLGKEPFHIRSHVCQKGHEPRAL